MVSRIVYRLLGSLGLAGLALAGYLYFYPLEEAATVVVEEPDRVLNDPPTGCKREVVFIVQNRGQREMRVVGAPST